MHLAPKLARNIRRVRACYPGRAAARAGLAFPQTRRARAYAHAIWWLVVDVARSKRSPSSLRRLGRARPSATHEMIRSDETRFCTIRSSSTSSRAMLAGACRGAQRATTVLACLRTMVPTTPTRPKSGSSPLAWATTIYEMKGVMRWEWILNCHLIDYEKKRKTSTS